MISIIQNSPASAKLQSKPYIYATGKLLDALKPGFPALFTYKGRIIRTSTVQFILEAASDHICFETMNSIYTITEGNLPSEATGGAA